VRGIRRITRSLINLLVVLSNLLALCLGSLTNSLGLTLRGLGKVVRGIFCTLSRLRPRRKRFFALFLISTFLVLNLIPTSAAQAQFRWGPPNTWNVIAPPGPLNAVATSPVFEVQVDGVDFVDIQMTIDDTASGILEGLRDGEPPQAALTGSPFDGGYPVGDPRRRNLWARINPGPPNPRGKGVTLTIQFLNPVTSLPFPVNVSSLEIFDIDRDGVDGNPNDDWSDEVVVSGFNGASPVLPTVATPTTLAVPSSWRQVTVGSTVVVTGIADGQSSGVPNGNQGTAVVSFPTNRVDTIVLNYRETTDTTIPVANNPENHAIGLLGPIDFALPDLILAKTATEAPPATVNRGADTTYTLQVTNIATGPNAGSTYGPITITDTLPTGLTFISGTGTNWSCSAVGQVVTCTYTGPDIAPNGGTAPPVTLTVNVGGTATSFTNTSTVSTAGDSNTTNNTDNATIDVVAPDLTILKTANSPPFPQSGTGSYTLAVTNVATGASAGPTTGPITITDTLPTGLTFISGTGTNWSCSAVGQVVTCTYTGPAIPANGGTAPPVTLTVNVGTDTSYTNTASVSTPGDSNPGNNSDPETVTTIAGPPPNITTAKTATLANDVDGSGGITPGDILTYTITVSNAAGAGDATTVVVTDPIPANTTYLPNSLQIDLVARTDAAGDDTANFDGTNAVFRLGTGANAANGGTLAGGATSTVRYQVTLGTTAPPEVINTATVSGGNFANQNPTTTTPVDPAGAAPAIDTNKTATLVNDADNSGTITVGDTLEYLIRVANTSPAGTALGVTVTDPIPANTTYAVGTLRVDGVARTDLAGDDTANFDGTNVVFRLGAGANATNGGALAPGTAAEARFRIVLGAGAPPQVTNTATVSGTNFPTRNPVTTTPVVVAGSPNLRLVKRITAVNGNAITTVVDVPGDPNDNAPNWPAGFLRGAVEVNANPGDRLEYTIYFLSDGAGPARSVRICDRINSSQTYLDNSFNGLTPTDGGLSGNLGIALRSGTSTVYLNSVTDGDRGEFLAPATTPPANCNITNPDPVTGALNPKGVVIVDVNNATLTELPPATAPGTPPTSSGFIRFRTQVD